MKRAKCLIGVKMDTKTGEITARSLVRASDVFLIDDTTLQRLFVPVSCPKDELLEMLYETLGSKWLSQSIKERCVPVEVHAPAATATKELSLRIKERIPILLHGRDKKVLKRKGREVVDGLSVMEATSIKRTFSLNGDSRTVSTTACAGDSGAAPSSGIMGLFTDWDKSNRGASLTLCVTKAYEYFDVGQVLASIILKHSTMNDALLFSTILSSTKESLEAKGFPVDRMMMPIEKIAQSISSDPKQLASFPAAAAAAPPAPPAARRPTTAAKPLMENQQSKLPVPRQLQDVKNVQRQTQKQNLQAAAGAMKKSQAAAPEQTKKPQGAMVRQNEKPRRNSTGFLHSLMSNLFSSSNGQIPQASLMKANERDSYLSGLQQVKNSLKRSHAKQGNHVANDIAEDPPLPVRQVYSECTHDKGLVRLNGITAGGLQCFAAADKAANSALRSEAGLQLANELASILTFLARRVFELDTSCLHLYWDSSAKHIAFNTNGSLFFNVYFHARVKPYDGTRAGALVYWLSTLIHELAHNTRGPHDAEFSRACAYLWEGFFTKAAAAIGK